MKKSKPEPIPVMDYRQYRRARRLVHECCNYDGGNCIALDDGEECVCVQSISYSLNEMWQICSMKKFGSKRDFCVMLVRLRPDKDCKYPYYKKYSNTWHSQLPEIWQ